MVSINLPRISANQFPAVPFPPLPPPLRRSLSASPPGLRALRQKLDRPMLKTIRKASPEAGPKAIKKATPEAGTVQRPHSNLRTSIPPTRVLLPPNPRTDLEVGGRLAYFELPWRAASRWVYRVVTTGLHLNFRSTPPIAPWSTSSLVSEECMALINTYVTKGAIVPSSRALCHCSRIFAIPKASGGLRLIFDLRSINNYITPLTTRFTGHQRLRQLLPLGAWMACLDIQDAYLHVLMHPDMRKYLCFQANGRRFEFTSLPFGLNIAPLVFTSLLRPIIRKLRSEHINVLAYLDDLIIWDTSAITCEKAVLRSASILQEHGFLIHLEKSQPTPSQQKDWLGFRWDSLSNSAALTPHNVDKIKHQCNLILHQGHTCRSEIASLQGRLAFAAQLLPRTCFLKRSLTPLLRWPPHNDTELPLSVDLRVLLQKWAHTDALEEKGRLHPPPPDQTIWTDASREGWGLHDTNGGTVHGKWSNSHSHLHINALELLTVKFALASHLARPGQCVAVFTDNLATYYACLKQGSIKSSLMHKIYGEILDIIVRKNLTLIPKRIPGIRNVLADALSLVRVPSQRNGNSTHTTSRE